MNEIFARITVSGRQVAIVFVFILISSVAQMANPSLLATMIDTGVGGNLKYDAGREVTDEDVEAAEASTRNSTTASSTEARGGALPRASVSRR